MAVFFWYLVKIDLSSVHYCTRAHGPSHCFQGNRKSWPYLTGHPVPKKHGHPVLKLIEVIIKNITVIQCLPLKVPQHYDNFVLDRGNMAFTKKSMIRLLLLRFNVPRISSKKIRIFIISFLTYLLFTYLV